MRRLLQLLIFLAPAAFAQTPGKPLQIPDIQGYKTVKCDFHMHTVFSDGKVQPEDRVAEAKREGIDAIAITDHMEFQQLRTFFAGDLNRPFNRALKMSQDSGIILVRGTEITRTMPPGHFNVLFLSNVNKVHKLSFYKAILAARKQGAFILWNHPAWKPQIHDSARFYRIHEKLIANNLLDGMEIVNDVDYYPVVFRWCLTRNKAVIGNSDVHGSTEHSWKISSGGHRPMTLVFAKEKKEESIKEGMMAGRTVVWQYENLYGRPVWLTPLFYACVDVKEIKRDGSQLTMHLENKSDIPFELLCDFSGGAVKLSSRGNAVLKVVFPEGKSSKENFVNCTVLNAFIEPGKNLVVKFPIVP